MKAARTPPPVEAYLTCCIVTGSCPVQCITLAFGGAVGFFHGDMAAIFDDMQTLNPTLVVAVPRFWNHIYAEWKAELARRTEEGTSYGCSAG